MVLALPAVSRVGEAAVEAEEVEVGEAAVEQGRIAFFSKFS